MSPESSDQNGHNRPRPRYWFTRKWRDIPVEVLREFGARLRVRYTQRGLARMLKLSQAAVADFIAGRTEPEERTRKAFAKLYFVFYPEGYSEKQLVKREVVPQFKEVLPDGEPAALERIEKLIAAGEDAGLPTAELEALRDWMITVVRAQYDTERRFAKFERKRRAKGEPGANAE